MREVVSTEQDAVRRWLKELERLRREYANDPGIVKLLELSAASAHDWLSLLDRHPLPC